MSSSEERPPVHDDRQILSGLDSMLSRHELLNREMVEILSGIMVQVQARVLSRFSNDVLLVHETPEGQWRNNINDATSVVEKMPTAMATTDDDVCSICLVGFQGGAATPKQPPCGHVYHQICLVTWLCSSKSCPLCRRTII